MVEVGLILLHDLAQMALIEDEEKVQAFAPQAAQKSLADGIGLRRLIGCGQNLNPAPIRHPVEGIAELVVVVANQESWSLAKRGCCPQLLSDPGIVGTSGDAEMQQSSRTEFNDDKDKDGAEEQVIGLQGGMCQAL